MPLQRESGTEDIGSNTGEMCRKAWGEGGKNSHIAGRGSNKGIWEQEDRGS